MKHCQPRQQQQPRSRARVSTRARLHARFYARTRNDHPRLQTGATTLAVTVLVLCLASLLSIGVSRTTQMDQRMAANQQRARQAFLAAEAGMAHALSLLAERDASSARLLGIDRAQRGIADEIAPLPDRVTGAYRVAYCNPEDSASHSINCPDAPGSPTCDRLDAEA
ncbi:MAG: pilus assembly PilX N-terminal domain-containing protein, partial [Halochromatium sp.]